MHYFIDGYNMLFRILHAGDDLRTQRESLVQDLQCKIHLLKIQATLVFDSHYQPHQGSCSVVDTLEIVFTPEGQTADEYILQQLKELESTAAYTVVTSDKKLAWLCRRRLAKTESIEDFIAALNKRYKNRLRQNKQKAAPQNPLIAPVETSSALSRPLRPLIRDSAPLAKETKNEPKKVLLEESYDFYLTTFEEEYKKLVPQPNAQEALKQVKSKRKKAISKKIVDPEEAHLSDMERWERTFERKAKEEMQF